MKLTNNSSIRIFHNWASMEWPDLFSGEYISFDEWQVLCEEQERAKSNVRKRMEEDSRYTFYDHYVFPQHIMRPIEVINDILLPSNLSHRIYNSKKSSSSYSGQCCSYFLESTFGMYIIFADTNESGLVKGIHVKVFHSFDEYVSEIATEWTEMNEDISYSIKKMMNKAELYEILSRS
jgi:hypothetical protein